MAGMWNRTLSLRTVLRHLSPFRTFSPTATTRPSPVDLCSPFPISSSWQFGACCQRLHTGADGPKTSPAAAPERLPFSRVTQEDLDYFRKILPGRAITDPDLLESSNVDWLKSVKGEVYHWIKLVWQYIHNSESYLSNSSLQVPVKCCWDRGQRRKFLKYSGK